MYNPNVSNKSRLREGKKAAMLTTNVVSLSISPACYVLVVLVQRKKSYRNVMKCDFWGSYIGSTCTPAYAGNYISADHVAAAQCITSCMYRRVNSVNSHTKYQNRNKKDMILISLCGMVVEARQAGFRISELVHKWQFCGWNTLLMRDQRRMARWPDP